MKILLNKAVKNNVITFAQLKSLMKEMQDDVVDKIIEDSYAQALCIGRLFDLPVGSKMYKFLHMISVFNADPMLSSYMSSMPTQDVFVSRQESGIGLTMPEISTLVSCSKIYLFNEFLKAGNDFFKNKIFDGILESYFPSLMVEEFGSYVLSHELRSNIVATILANEIVNYFGFTFFQDVCGVGSIGTEEFLLSYAFARNLTNLHGTLVSFQKAESSIGLSVFYKGLAFISESIKIATIMTSELLKSKDFDIEECSLFVQQFMDGISNSRLLNDLDRRAFDSAFSFKSRVSDASLMRHFELFFVIEDVIACLSVVRRVQSFQFENFFSLYKRAKDILHFTSIKTFVREKHFVGMEHSFELLNLAREILSFGHRLCLKMLDYYMLDGVLDEKCKNAMQNSKFDIGKYEGVQLDADRVKIIMNDMLNHLRYIAALF